METDKDHIHFLISYDTKVYQNPRVTAKNLQSSSYRLKAVSFRLLQTKGFYL